MSSATPSRALGMLEWSMWLTGLGLATNCMVLGEVLGPLDEDVLKAALGWTQTRHPLLRVRVGVEEERPCFWATDAPIPLRTEHGDWLSAAMQELHTPIDSERGPLLRCLLVRHEDERATLVICFSHVVVDGYSMVAVLDDVLRAASALLAGTTLKQSPLPARQAIEALLPARARGLAVLPGVAGLMLREQLDRARVGAPRSFVEREPALDQRRTEVIPQHFDEEETARLVRLSRSHGVPVQCTLGAAQLLGVADEIAAGDVALWIGSSVNLRPVLNPPITASEVGLFVSMVGSTLKVDARDSLWDLAKVLRSDQSARLARAEQLLTFPLGSKAFATLRPWLSCDRKGGQRLIALMKKLFPAGTAISNLGQVVMHSADRAPLRLEHLHFVATESVLPLTTTALTFRGRLHWNFMNNVQKQGACVTERIVARLRHAVVAA